LCVRRIPFDDLDDLGAAPVLPWAFGVRLALLPRRAPQYKHGLASDSATTLAVLPSGRRIGMPSYDIEVTRDGRWWAIHIPAINGLTQARFPARSRTWREE
jgi:hypothetical protein